MGGLGDFFEEYRRLAELHKWGGNPYLLASKVWRMRQALEKVLVDHRRYEEAIQEIMRKGKSWDEIASYIDGVVKESRGRGPRRRVGGIY
jgi:hypothetical protein